MCPTSSTDRVVKVQPGRGEPGSCGPEHTAPGPEPPSQQGRRGGPSASCSRQSDPRQTTEQDSSAVTVVAPRCVENHDPGVTRSTDNQPEQAKNPDLEGAFGLRGSRGPQARGPVRGAAQCSIATGMRVPRYREPERRRQPVAGLPAPSQPSNPEGARPEVSESPSVAGRQATAPRSAPG
jgi:hypothetical protein